MDKEYSRNQGRREDNGGERDYNKKRDSFRPDNNDRGENRERRSNVDGNFRERREYRSEGNHYNSERGNADRQERNYNKDSRGNSSYGNRNTEGGEKRRFFKEGERPQRREGNFQGGERKRDFGGNNRPVRDNNGNYGERRDGNNAGGDRRRDYDGNSRPARESSGSYGDRRERSYNQDKRRNDNDYRERRSYHEKAEDDRRYSNNSNSSRPERREYSDRGESRFPARRNEYSRSYPKEISKEERHELQRGHYSKKKILAHRLKNETAETELRLNRYISMGGICSRRDADELIKSGRVKVNGQVVLTVGVKVQKKDKVEVDDAVIIPERKVYLALNKPKDYVTTVDDPLERKTVMALVEGACKERIYPVGRLDRQTTGILLFTNDGELAKKLTHPKYDNKKIYHVFLDKPVTEQDMEAIATGIELEDGLVQADEIRYASDDQMEVGIEIHSGKNRIVRRIFEHFGYQIVKLDRVYFAGITKKNIPRGRWRFLMPEEINMLKYY